MPTEAEGFTDVGSPVKRAASSGRTAISSTAALPPALSASPEPGRRKLPLT
jgi:hypothetical protein